MLKAHKIISHKIISVIILIIFIASLILAAAQIISRAGFGIGFWFPPLYFLILAAVTNNLDKLKKALHKLYKPFIYIFYSGMSAFCAAFIIFCVVITSYNAEPPPDNPDLIIVLGCQVVGYEPGVLLTHRLDTAVQALNKYPGSACIVSGGQGPDEIIPESQAMRRYLISNNIYQERIFEEAQSSNTFENLIFSRDIIAQNNLNHARIIILTSEYHIPRAVMLARRIYNNAQIYAVKSPTPFTLFSAGITREFFAFVKSLIFDKE